MKKLAIISTYNENCGNASYTHVLRKEFEKYVHVDVIPLDLFLLQSTIDSLIDAGDRHIKQICALLSEYDYVNVQFEAGLFGASISDIKRRIAWVIDAAKNITVTMHRVDVEDYRYKHAFRDLLRLHSPKKIDKRLGASKFARLSRYVVEYCTKAAKKKNVWIKVHTKRERRSVSEIYQNNNVYDYPLVFLNEVEKDSAKRITDRSGFLNKYGFSGGDVIIGLFGYLSNYKGIETAIESLKYLPENYKLALFGSQHPQSVKRNEQVNPYLESLFKLMEVIDEQKFLKFEKLAPLDWVYSKGADNKVAADDYRKSIKDRVFFIGGLPDPEFIEALHLTDVVVLPYIEVGQSMSGVAVLSIEAGGKVLCANNNSFKETRRYFPDTFGGFDVGNSIELAQKIKDCGNCPDKYVFGENREKAFSRFNIESSIVTQLEKFGHVF